MGDRVVTVSRGANAEYVKIGPPETELLMRFDGSVSFVEAATTEPLGTSLHAVNLAEPKDGEIHVIVGAGIIGLGVLNASSTSRRRGPWWWISRTSGWRWRASSGRI